MSSILENVLKELFARVQSAATTYREDVKLSLWKRYSAMAGHELREAMTCLNNCSGHGVCYNGSCICHIKFEGQECKTINLSYHVAFSSVFFLLALTSLLQLVMCIHAEYLRIKKNPTLAKACRITTQKLLYFLVFLAATLRGAYFAAPSLSQEWSLSLLSSFYPLVLSGSSLIVCFWAEVFHLREIRWDKPRFLSKSFLGFVAFNLITYSLLVIELFFVWIGEGESYTHIFNGCYAVLMFIVVVFFLIYGVEVFFKVRGGFTFSHVPSIISSARTPLVQRQSSRTQILDELQNSSPKKSQSSNSEKADEKPEEEDVFLEQDLKEQVRRPVEPSTLSDEERNQMINTSQLHQSRLGLLSQALLMIITVGFLFSETLEELWKTKVDLSSRNTHDIIFHTVEIGVALWFPCVLWNCIRPEQLWCLNPKKILMRFPPLKEAEHHHNGHKVGVSHEDCEGCMQNSCSSSDTTDEDDKGPECWICYDSDRTDCGPFINPCDCKGDVGAVHHDCLKRWLVESADNPDALKCKVCNATYMVEKGSQFSLSQGFTWKQCVVTTSVVMVMCLSLAGCWALIQLYSEAWIRMLAVGAVLLVQYICLRVLGLSTVTAYQRAKVSALKIVSLRRHGGESSQPISMITSSSPPRASRI